MEQRMVIIYGLIEEFFKGVIRKEEHSLLEISDSEVLFLGYSRFTRIIIQLEKEIEIICVSK